MIDLTNKYYTDEQKAKIIMGCKETEERLREHNINEELIKKIMKDKTEDIKIFNNRRIYV